MTTTIDVIYEGGVLRPLQTLDWQEGEQHTLTYRRTLPLPAQIRRAEAWRRFAAETTSSRRARRD